MISADPIPGLPELHPGDDLAALIAAALRSAGRALQAGDVVVVAHKAVSKVEGRTRRLGDVEPSDRALQLAAAHDKDPRQVQVVLDESREVIRAVRGVLICETRHGFICANAGVDASNVPGEETVLMLPLDPDGSARALRERLTELTGVRPGVVITDSFGRAWRVGQCDVAIGVAGLEPVEDWRGRPDAGGREMLATVIAVADQLAAVADLARAKDAMQPVVIVSGAGRHVLTGNGPGAAALIRHRDEDLFR
ncbi:MAG TPA: coenzyme F420-0:L-glutamate ligase [Solirubrobacteraceae bacterium]|jgi:coenzyme F420-0:L-glutamate ligase/coenzyme F420-1:gamma-L-glutamate ligase|nr:coenzyme F420-0:L-glutamate ligase [Solirubrobacteraceae bacterium]